MKHVKDRDHGMKAVVKAAAKVDGLELRNGILDSRQRYPSTSGAKGQEIAKVAGIHKIHRAISEAYDRERATIDRGMAHLHRALLAGDTGLARLIYERLGVPIRDTMRTTLYGVVRRRTGRMGEAVRATVFEGGRVGGRGPAASGTVAAGDNPHKPRAR